MILLRHFFYLSRSFEIRLLILAMIVGIAASSTLSFWQSRFLHEFDEKKASLLAGDVVLSTFFTIPQDWIETAKQTYHLRQEKSLELYTMLRTQNEQSQLGRLFAVGDHFPLKGGFTIFAAGQTRVVQQAPTSQSVWMSQSLLDGLHLKVGDTVMIGASALKIAAVLVDMPNFSNELFSIAPPVLMNLNDIEASGLVKAGSRVNERWHFVGTKQDEEAFEAWVKPKLSNTITISTKATAGPTLQASFEKGVRYITFANMMNLLLASLAIVMASKSFIEKHQSAIALLRTFGMSHQQLLKVLLVYVLLIVGIALTLGVAIGFLIQRQLLQIVQTGMLTTDYSPTLYPVYQSMMLALLMGWGFILTPLWKIRRMHPLLVFKTERTSTAAVLRSLLVMGLVLVGIVWIETHDLAFALPLLGYILLGFGVGYLVLRKIMQSVGRIQTKNIPLYFALHHFKTNLSSHTLSTLLFSSILFILLILGAVRESLLQTWQGQIKSDAPNYFIVNIEENEKAAVKQFFETHAMQAAPFYPMLRASLIQINDEAVLQVANNVETDKKSMNRPLNLTWVSHLPADNEVIEGTPWQNAGLDAASVEIDFAKRMGIQVGDKLTFSVGEQNFVVTVVNLRQVKWDNFQPNFFVITKPEWMKTYTDTLITSFYLPKEKLAYLSEFNQQFPTVTVIDVGAILKQLLQVVTTMGFILKLIFYFSFIGALLVMMIMLQANLKANRQQAALLRVMGASKRMIQKMVMYEWVMQALLSGSVAVIAAMGTSQWVAIKYFHLKGIMPSAYWLATPLLAACVIVPWALWGSRTIWRTHPKVLLSAI